MNWNINFLNCALVKFGIKKPDETVEFGAPYHFLCKFVSFGINKDNEFEIVFKIIESDRRSMDALDTDHGVSLDLVVQIINKEIQWCYQNPIMDEVSREYRKGFIKGLEETKNLIIEVAIQEEVVYKSE